MARGKLLASAAPIIPTDANYNHCSKIGPIMSVADCIGTDLFWTLNTPMNIRTLWLRFKWRYINDYDYDVNPSLVHQSLTLRQQFSKVQRTLLHVLPGRRVRPALMFSLLTPSFRSCGGGEYRPSSRSDSATFSSPWMTAMLSLSRSAYEVARFTAPGCRATMTALR